MKYFTLVVVLLLLAGFAFAADIDGKWAGEIVGQNMEIGFTFKAEGTTLILRRVSAVGSSSVGVGGFIIRNRYATKCVKVRKESSCSFRHRLPNSFAYSI